MLSNKVAQKSYAQGLHKDDEEEEQTYNARLAFEKICSYEPPEGKLRTSLQRTCVDKILGLGECPPKDLKIEEEWGPEDLNLRLFFLFL